MIAKACRALLLLVFSTVGASCTSLYPVKIPNADIEQQVRSGQLLSVGDKVRLTTADGGVHEFAIAAIDTAGGTVNGARDSVRIAEITTVAQRRVSIGKTLGLVLGVVGGLVIAHDTAEIVTGHGY